ncbi:MAG TPA: helix-turn-helix domain-containing protein [Candidatus Limnocylindria bacterium]|nr:helix-turn-helix domain-containing protein [Candidatus Limnocylindria bacterium]
MEIQVILKNFGLSEKEIAVYLALIELGPSSVRDISAKSKVNRGTSYDILKSLMEIGVVSYYNKESKQYFIAEPPEKLLSAIDQKKEDLDEVRGHIEQSLPLIKTLFEKQGGKPSVKLYEGAKGIRQILEDVLQSAEKEYYLYSSSTVQDRKNIYSDIPDFSKKRIAKNIKVKIISLGEGGQLAGLDERKQMPTGENDIKSTHEIIYAGKVAHISLDDKENPVGVVIQNEAIYQTQKLIFDQVWNKL